MITGHLVRSCGIYAPLVCGHRRPCGFDCLVMKPRSSTQCAQPKQRLGKPGARCWDNARSELLGSDFRANGATECYPAACPYV
eukprot:scaffold20885_cov58-Phaeocystis_antarctica.AAC.6